MSAMQPEPGSLDAGSSQVRRDGVVLRRSLEWSLCGLALSGALWLVATRVLATPGEFGEQVPEWTHLALTLHGGLAMAFLVAVGGWLQHHVAPRIRRPAGRTSGLIQLLFLLLLGASGYGLYYWATDASRPVWSYVHWIGGLVLLATLLVHTRARRLSPSD